MKTLNLFKILILCLILSGIFIRKSKAQTPTIVCNSTASLSIEYNPDYTYNWSVVGEQYDIYFDNEKNTEVTVYNLPVDVEIEFICSDDQGYRINEDDIIVVNKSVTANAGKDQTICQGESVELLGEGNGNIVWENISDSQSPRVTVSPEETCNYILEVSNEYCPKAFDKVRITVEVVTFNVDKENVSSSGANDGSITLSGIEANGYYKLNGESNAPLNNLEVGIYTVEVINENECSATRQVSIQKNSTNTCDIPVDFNYEEESDLLIVFTNVEANVENFKYFWSFGDGKFDKELISPSHVYEKEGIYDVCLVAYQDEACANRVCKEIEVGDVKCNAIFTYENTDNGGIQFNNISTANIETIHWDFGNGMTSNETKPNIQFSPGDYYVKLTIKDINGCIDESTERIIVGNTNCLADFNFVKLPDNKIAVYDASTGNISSRYWTFGDGNYLTAELGVNQYITDGIYEVCLTVYDEQTKSQSKKCQKVQIGADVCKADFAVVRDGVSIYLENKSIGDKKHYWTFGDGNFSVLSEPEHQYANLGEYQVCLYISNEAGSFDRTCTKIELAETPCKAQFTYHVDPDTKKVEFIDNSIVETSIEGWFWNFGDENTSAEQSSANEYAETGIYPVTFSIKAGECKSSYTEMVQVGTINCEAKFDYIIEPITQKVTFVNKSQGQLISNYYWDFGNGKQSTLATPPTHSFFRNGVMEVSLTVTGDECSAKEVKKIQIGKIQCKSDFKTFINPANNTVHFINKSIGDFATYYWQFGDGSYSEEANPVRNYNGVGYYEVFLTTKTATCINSSKKFVLVSDQEEKLRARFNHRVNDNVVKCISNSVGNISNYIWTCSVGDSLYKNEGSRQTEFNIQENGIYQVCLTVFDENTTRNTRCNYVNVSSSGDVIHKADFIYSVSNKTITVSDKSIGEANEWIWDFGDGEDKITTTNSEYSYTFKEKGVYLVHLKTKNAQLYGENHKFKLINVGAEFGLEARIGYSFKETRKKSGNLGYPVDIVGTSFGPSSIVAWDFDDETTDNTTLEQTHVYDEPGTYDVDFSTTDPNTGQTSTTTQQIVITDNTSAVNKFDISRTTLTTYPNPAIDNANISFTIDNKSAVELSVYDTSGKKIANLVNSDKSAGKYNISWNCSTVDTGIYFMKLTTALGTVVSRFVVE